MASILLAGALFTGGPSPPEISQDRILLRKTATQIIIHVTPQLPEEDYNPCDDTSSHNSLRKTETQMIRHIIPQLPKEDCHPDDQTHHPTTSQGRLSPRWSDTSSHNGMKTDTTDDQTHHPHNDPRKTATQMIRHIIPQWHEEDCHWSDIIPTMAQGRLPPRWSHIIPQWHEDWQQMIRSSHNGMKTATQMIRHIIPQLPKEDCHPDDQTHHHTMAWRLTPQMIRHIIPTMTQGRLPPRWSDTSSHNGMRKTATDQTSSPQWPKEDCHPDDHTLSHNGMRTDNRWSDHPTMAWRLPPRWSDTSSHNFLRKTVTQMIRHIITQWHEDWHHRWSDTSSPQWPKEDCHPDDQTHHPTMAWGLTPQMIRHIIPQWHEDWHHRWSDTSSHNGRSKTATQVIWQSSHNDMRQSATSKSGSVHPNLHSTHFIYGYMASDIW